MKKITAKQYKAKLLLYQKEDPTPKIEINRSGKMIVLKRTFTEELLVEDVDKL